MDMKPWLQVQSVLRHGIRNPSKGDVASANSVLAKFRATGASAELVNNLTQATMALF